MYLQSVSKIVAGLAVAIFGLSTAANAGGCGRGYGGGYGGGYSSYQSQPSARYAAQVRAKKIAAARAASAASRKRVALAQARSAKNSAKPTVVADAQPKIDADVKTSTVAAKADVEQTTVAVVTALPKCYRFFPAIGERVEVACDTTKSNK
ncbi:MAG: hypothetical protein CTY31_04250 [Hyphomicrobium sp.]|nr:MAG: hypothetical protein CTY39_03560 [Hyphomicrobium sp.]PPD00366.1 MAG: hypothetical protein CTY31_04250 [Hyphomicrobium sp.]